VRAIAKAIDRFRAERVSTRPRSLVESTARHVVPIAVTVSPKLERRRRLVADASAADRDHGSGMGSGGAR
jgi:hypothetical protein